MPDITPIFPLPTILLQILLLLVTIAIEALLLHNRLLMSRKTSVEYSISLNLFSTAFCWMIFLYTQAALTPRTQIKLINYVFFNRSLIEQTAYEEINQILLIIGVVSFFVICLIEYKLVDILQAILEPESLQKDSAGDAPLSLMEANRKNRAKRRLDNRKLNTVFLANALSTLAGAALILIATF
ncbi:MAG: filament integrity protein FraC [Spirulinaceae cyanobacterium]